MINPRGGLVYTFNEKLNMKLLYGEAFRSPKVYEVYSDVDNVMTKNLDLKSERLKSYEASFIYTPLKQVLAEATFYYNDMYDLERCIAECHQSFSRPQNSHQYHTLHSEIHFRKKLLQELQ